VPLGLQPVDAGALAFLGWTRATGPAYRVW
jgi:hypothetical protein